MSIQGFPDRIPAATSTPDDDGAGTPGLRLDVIESVQRSAIDANAAVLDVLNRLPGMLHDAADACEPERGHDFAEGIRSVARLLSAGGTPPPRG